MKSNSLAIVAFTASAALVSGKASAENLINEHAQQCITDAVKNYLGSASLKSIEKSPINPRNYMIDFDTASIVLNFGSYTHSVTINGVTQSKEGIALNNVSMIAWEEEGDTEVVQQAKRAITECFTP